MARNLQRMYRGSRGVLVVLGATAVMAVPGQPALAGSGSTSMESGSGNAFTVTLHCADGRVLTGESIEQNSGRPFLVQETTGVLVQMTGSYVNLDAPDEPEVVFEDTPGTGLTLLTCTYDIVYGGARLHVTGGFLDTTR